MPRIPIIKKMHMIIMRTLKIPSIDSPKDEIIIFISGFLEIILKGLKVLKSFKIERPIFIVMSITATITMKKSSLDQLLLRYACYPKISP